MAGISTKTKVLAVRVPLRLLPLIDAHGCRSDVICSLI